MEKLFTVLIPDAESGHALSVVRCLSEKKEILVHSLSKNPKPALKYSLRSKSFRVLETDENNEIRTDSLKKAIERTNADIILPIDEDSIYYFSKNLEYFNKIVALPPIPSVNTFQNSTNKWLLSKFLKEKDIPSSTTIFADKSFDFLKKLKNLQFPVMAKPAVGNGGVGIYKLEDYSQVKKFFTDEIDKSLGDYIIQEFIDGYDIDCSILCNKGEILAYTIQKGIVPRSQSFAASGGIQFLRNDELFELVNKFVKEIGFNGIAHIDLRYNNKTQNYMLLEVNARYWGSLTGSLLAGINFPYLSCLLAKGISFDKPKYNHGFYIDHITASKNLIKGIFHKLEHKIHFKETDFKYILRDPIAEIYNSYLRSQQ